METGFCTHCGAKLAENAGFCNNCGAKIEMIKGVPAATPIKTDPHPESGTEVQYVGPSQPYIPPKGQRPIRQRPKIVGYAVGIIFLIAVPFIVFAILGSLNLNYLDTLEFQVSSFTETNVELNIDLDVGSLEIYYDQTLSNMIEAELDVWGRPNADIADAKNFVTSNDTPGVLTISFDSGDRSFWYWDKTTFNYDIRLYIHPSANVEFNVDAGTGSVAFDTNAIDYLNIEGLFLESGTGTLSLDLSGSLNTSIQEMYLDTGTGSILADLGLNTSLNSSSVMLETGTGTITLSYEDLIVFDDFTWILDTGTGSINLAITQNTILPIVYETVIDASTGTGSIGVIINLNPAIGLKVAADVGTGSTDIFGSSNNFESANYDTANNTYNLLLHTGTGSVEVV